MGSPNYQRLAELGRLPDSAVKKYGFQQIKIDRMTKLIEDQAIEIEKLKKEIEASFVKPAVKVSTKKVKAPVKKVASKRAKPVKKEDKIMDNAKKELDDMLGETSIIKDDTIIRG